MSEADELMLPSGPVRARYGGVSHMWLERRLKDNSGFPKPHYIGRLRFWRLSDLVAWERTLTQKSPVAGRDRAREIG